MKSKPSREQYWSVRSDAAVVLWLKWNAGCCLMPKQGLGDVKPQMEKVATDAHSNRMASGH